MTNGKRRTGAPCLPKLNRDGRTMQAEELRRLGQNRLTAGIPTGVGAITSSKVLRVPQPFYPTTPGLR